MAVVVKTTSTLFRPVAIGLRSPNRGDYRNLVNVNSRAEWLPMAGRMDWDSVSDLDEFHVRVRFAEYEETRKESKHATYDGRRDARRVPGGERIGRTVCKVVRGKGAHAVYTSHSDGTKTRRVIPQDKVMQTARLFLSVSYLRRDLQLRIGPNVWHDTTCMIIKPA